MKYLRLLLPLAAVWLAFYIHHVCALDPFDWRAFPLLLTSIFGIFLSIVLAAYKF